MRDLSGDARLHHAHQPDPVRLSVYLCHYSSVQGLRVELHMLSTRRPVLPTEAKGLANLGPWFLVGSARPAAAQP